MLRYAFDRITVDRGVFVGKSLDHQEAILRRAAEGWRYAGWIPATQINGGLQTIDLIFEREEGQA